ncbi:YndM family protein [Alkalihalobacillus sp. AL-G]|uniref:YndM family protein n=1 Tax=Alkalihalobacillus sp. AL-G TaxID=2926399 RepID=UPI00272BA823|nr:YndM family protein [Alkalihalobacillus sp. AL-G]WLD94245.1 YndM family protein [Alkalihalobacillus sp. AL-G]
MRHIVALLTKFTMLIGVLYISLTVFFGVSFLNVLGIALLLTIVGYALGDLFILKRFGNVIATMADAGLTFLAAWFLADVFIDTPANQFYAGVSAAAITAIGEFVFHMFIQALRPLKPTQNTYNLNYGTEFGEELSPRQDDNEDNK